MYHGTPSNIDPSNMTAAQRARVISDYGNALANHEEIGWWIYKPAYLLPHPYEHIYDALRAEIVSPQALFRRKEEYLRAGFMILADYILPKELWPWAEQFSAGIRGLYKMLDLSPRNPKSREQIQNEILSQPRERVVGELAKFGILTKQELEILEIYRKKATSILAAQLDRLVEQRNSNK